MRSRHFQSLYGGIAHQWYISNPIAQYEGFYASVFYSHFAALGLDIRLEDPTNQGRIDMTLLFAGQVFVFEFKVLESNPQRQRFAADQRHGLCRQVPQPGRAHSPSGRGVQQSPPQHRGL